MIGLVIWSDNTENKAVFWCEDHGDLAYFTAESKGSDSALKLQPGDMVQFDMSSSESIRLAHNPELISRKTCHGIQDKLRSSALTPKKPAPEQAMSGNVIRFPSDVPRHGYSMASGSHAGR